MLLIKTQKNDVQPIDYQDIYCYGHFEYDQINNKYKIITDYEQYKNIIADLDNISANMTSKSKEYYI